MRSDLQMETKEINELLSKVLPVDVVNGGVLHLQQTGRDSFRTEFARRVHSERYDPEPPGMSCPRRPQSGPDCGRRNASLTRSLARSFARSPAIVLGLQRALPPQSGPDCGRHTDSASVSCSTALLILRRWFVMRRQAYFHGWGTFSMTRSPVSRPTARTGTL